MTEHDFIIWSDDPYHTEDIEEYKKNMEEVMPGELDGYTDAEICERMAQESANWLNDERWAILKGENHEHSRNNRLS